MLRALTYLCVGENDRAFVAVLTRTCHGHVQTRLGPMSEGLFTAVIYFRFICINAARRGGLALSFGPRDRPERDRPVARRVPDATQFVSSCL